jgi:hypothetical protein
MNCQNCDAPIDAQMQACLKCGALLADASDKTKNGSNTHRTQRKIVFWVCLSLALVLLIIGAFFPSISDPIIKFQMSAVSSRGRDIYVAIIGANTEREPLGLGPVWPKTQLKPGTDVSSRDIAVKTFTNSTDYFYDIYDEVNEDTEKHKPYANGFDYSKLAGAGVPAKSDTLRLLAENNLWVIAANITDQDDDRIPLLISRNADVKEIERVVNQGVKESDFTKKIKLSKGDYKYPFGKEGFVCIRKGGGVFCYNGNYSTIGALFGYKELPPRDPSKTPIVYLMP